MSPCGKQANAGGRCGDVLCLQCYPLMSPHHRPNVAEPDQSHPSETTSRWRYVKGLWCMLFHHKSKVWTPGFHSWAFRCEKCGLIGEVGD